MGPDSKSDERKPCGIIPHPIRMLIASRSGEVSAWIDEATQRITIVSGVFTPDFLPGAKTLVPGESFVWGNFEERPNVSSQDFSLATNGYWSKAISISYKLIWIESELESDSVGSGVPS